MWCCEGAPHGLQLICAVMPQPSGSPFPYKPHTRWDVLRVAGASNVWVLGKRWQPAASSECAFRHHAPNLKLASTTCTAQVINNTETVWQVPSNPRGVLLVAHGCNHGAIDWWPRHATRCKTCIGKPPRHTITPQRGVISSTIFCALRHQLTKAITDLQPQCGWYLRPAGGNQHYAGGAGTRVCGDCCEQLGS